MSLSEQSSEELSDDHVKVAGEMVGKMDGQGVTMQVQAAPEVMIPDVRSQGMEKDPLSLYSEAIYAYTVSSLFDDGAEKSQSLIFSFGSTSYIFERSILQQDPKERRI